MDSVKVVQDVCRQMSISNPKISLIQSGYTNDIFRIDSTDGSFVARRGNRSHTAGSSLLNTFRTQKFFESEGVDFVPKVVWYDKQLGVLVEELVGSGNGNTPIFDMDKDTLSVFVDELVQIHTLDVDAFSLFCKEHEYGAPTVSNPMQDIQTFGIDRFERAKRTCPDKEVIEWIAPRLEENVKSIEVARGSSARIVHGDIGDDLIHDGQIVWMIDWEYSRIAHTRELSYIKIHSKHTTDQLAFVVKRYAEQSGVPEDVLWKEIEREERVTRLNDVIWAAMKWGESKKDEEKQDYFRQETYGRMSLYENHIPM